MGTPTGIKRWYSLNQVMREQIAEADPVGFLCDIAQGKAFKAAPTPGRGATTIVPTAKMRIDAARVLTAKVLPDLSISHVEASVDVVTHEDRVKQVAALVAGIPTPVDDAVLLPQSDSPPTAGADLVTDNQDTPTPAGEPHSRNDAPMLPLSEAAGAIIGPDTRINGHAAVDLQPDAVIMTLVDVLGAVSVGALLE
jgi:hypothetical protein